MEIPEIGENYGTSLQKMWKIRKSSEKLGRVEAH
jgi:hypothetical protein